MHWFRFRTHRQQYRRRRTYFRPTDTFALDAAAVSLIDCLVTVRFTNVADADSPFAGQRLYCILGEGLTFVRPERDFDFLE